MSDAEQTTEAKLTPKQRLFVTHYVYGKPPWNGTEAARLAGYKGDDVTLASVAYENLRKPQIRAELERLLDSIMPKAEVLGRLAEHARGTIDDFLTIKIEDVTIVTTVVSEGQVETETREIVQRPVAYLDLEKAAKAGKLHLIRELTDGPKGKTIKLYDAQSATEMLGKYHGLWVERKEISGPDGGPLEITEIVVSKTHDKPELMED